MTDDVEPEVTDADGPDAAPAAAKSRARLPRRILIVALPLALALVGGWVWVTGGRVVSTEDAYVQQDRVTIMPQVSGRIASVEVRENEAVRAGDVLFTIDDRVYANAVEADRARLASARLVVEKLKADYAEAVSAAETARETLENARTQDERQQSLVESGVVSRAAADDSALKLQQAKGAYAQASSKVVSARAALAGDPDIATDDHPAVLEALAALRAAELDLSNTRIVSPVSATVSQTDRLQQGQYVTPAVPVLTLVASSGAWIEANYKETDLTHMREGQQVEITLDAYPDLDLKGEIGSIGAGTGSEFALLPAQNASGNWVKVVQRVPVRVAIDADGTEPPLRAGMSATVETDTGRARGLPKPVAAILAAIGLGGEPAAADPRD